MAYMFIRSLESELLKTKRSSAAWLTIFGGLLLPAIFLLANLMSHTPGAIPIEHVWEKHFLRVWQNMALFLLPIGVILVSSLLTQIEYINNTWKQLHTTPQSLNTIFFAKIFVILISILRFFILFNIGILLSGFVTGLIYDDIPFLKQGIPFLFLFKTNIKFFICCLPIVSLQYLLGMHIKNYVVPIGIGMSIFISSLIGYSWKYVFLLPYNYCGLNFFSITDHTATKFNIYMYSLFFFIFFLFINYILYLKKIKKVRPKFFIRLNHPKQEYKLTPKGVNLKK